MTPSEEFFKRLESSGQPGRYKKANWDRAMKDPRLSRVTFLSSEWHAILKEYDYPEDVDYTPCACEIVNWTCTYHKP